MASEQQTVDYIAEQAAGAGFIRSRSMFGEYALYCDEKVVAFICDDTFYLKITDEGRKVLKHEELGQAYPGSKDYFVISADDWDDKDYISELVRVTSDALPAPKPKVPKKKS